jgi:hypothetical protein
VHAEILELDAGASDQILGGAGDEHVFGTQMCTTRDAMCTAIPRTSFSVNSTSLVSTPMRDERDVNSSGSSR